jgi:hypothetical protein
VDGKALEAGVVNENEVRAAAGITLVIAAVRSATSTSPSCTPHCRSVASFFFVEFLIRVTAGIQYSAPRTFLQQRRCPSARAEHGREWELGEAARRARAVEVNPTAAGSRKHLGSELAGG